MKKHVKWLGILFATLLVVVGIAAFNSQKANAAESTVVSSQMEVLKATPAVNITKAAPKVIGGGVVKPFYQWLPPQYCYWQSGVTTSTYYCYRYDCTYFERVAWGCYNGYVRINTVYWV